MKPIHLTLICHARTEAQRVGRFALDDEPLRDPPLLAPERSARYLTAPELRTRQTAEGLGAVVDDGLRDCDLGRWKGLPLKQLDDADLQAWLADPQAAPHGGESIAGLCQRVAGWMDSALSEGEWVAITHPFVIRAAMLHALGAPLQAFERIDVPPLARVRFSHSGLWRLQLG
ncbi:histidine phosphatase family protein [Pseudomonas sp. GD03858]|uniref:histidine phosphatase family protein n=1 Tax=unclassified Pseudomonas TaxID=196821 RepID=UPI002447FF7E|nr:MULTISPECIES: histidine phosphatase family protein [unclassified Pseudomonas]MDH0646578.1 histidine phosphatase family protein [Pseudomonas sp. GD03867]MDH0662294.1 histidine phosphatase family protein [Pseudomonas sp. GD03858]